MFIEIPNCSKADAFVLGDEIAEAVSRLFPAPIQLKFEKVQHECIASSHCIFPLSAPAVRRYLVLLRFVVSRIKLASSGLTRDGML